MKIGIYGGTYNPVHNGHINAAKNAIEQLKLDKLFMIPTATPPHKKISSDAAKAEDRLEMLKLAAQNNDKICISDIEIQRGGRSYTIDTLRLLRDKWPNSDIFLLLGTDMLIAFEKWFQFKEILKIAKLAVFARAECEKKEIYEFSENLRKKYFADVIIVENNVIDISSSEIRDLLKKREGNEYLDDAVYEYIIEKKLYGAEAAFPWLREKAYAMLKPKRIPHVKGCEEEAEHLALHWNADAVKAREAAILHDCTKKLSLQEQLVLCKEYDIEIDEMEMKSEKLLHSKTGAEIAKRKFGVSSDVYNAILWHTTGRENMTLLEKIIYMADYIEPTRKFKGVEILRMLAYENLDKAVEVGLEMSLKDMRENGIVPHCRSIEALEYLKTVLQN